MTTISNITIVVQQGDVARETQQLKPQPLDPSQMTPAQHAQREMEQRAVIKETDTADRIKPHQEKQQGSQSEAQKEQERERREKERKELNAEDPDGTGRLLDTVA
ncbi:MAG: hypothetical protein ACOZF0_15025 [Thermodesulfobacteriota bacterium]